MPESIALSVSVAPVVSFAMHQASIPVLSELRLSNTGNETIDDLTVLLECEPPVIAPRSWTFDRIAAESEINPADRTVALDGGMLFRLSERLRATITLRVMRGEKVLTESRHETIALARHEWGGSTSTPELLAAFVMPNDPGVAEVLRDASDLLRAQGKSPSLDGYQSQSRQRVWEMASAIWSAVAARQLIYAQPPASFEKSGQKVRLPSEVLSGRLATCLDTALLFAGALEQIGVNALICLTQGHAMTAAWLQPTVLRSVSTDDASDLRNYIKLRELILFETTVITSDPPATFSQALKVGEGRLREELDAEFVLALDVKQARARQVFPLPIEIETSPKGESHRAVSLPVEEPPPLPSFASESSDASTSDTPQSRLDAWKRQLLDLTKRNRLLNIRPSKTTIRLVGTDLGKLEDLLAKDEKITIVPLETLAGRGGGRDEQHLLVQQGVEFEREMAARALENNQLPAKLGDAELKAGIIELFRKAKSDLEEGGANTLFLAIGMLRWREAESSTTWLRAPLILVPVKLERATAASPPRMLRHTDETRFNMTLLEMLRQDHNLRIPALEGDLPRDSHGVDVGAVLQRVRMAIRDVQGWEVMDEAVLSTFAFAKYLMWKDLSDHAEELRGTPFVKHMIDTPRNVYRRAPEFVRASRQDDVIDPASLLTPLPSDSSQVAAIHASGLEGDFVLEGPPGTGKSQTIANLIAHNLGLGRKVLFVAEKMTALNVVQDRLKKVGLGDFCLELHSSKANRRDVVAQLNRAWNNRQERTASAWEQEAARLKRIRDQLNGVVKALHTPGTTGVTPRDAISRASSSRFAPSVALDWTATLSADLAGDAAGLERMREFARELGQAFSQITAEDAQTFASIQYAEWSYQWQGALVTAATKAIAAIDEARTAAARFVELSNVAAPSASTSDLQRLADFAELIPSAADMNLEAYLAPEASELGTQLQRARDALQSHRAAVAALSVSCDGSTVTPRRVAEVRRAWSDASGKVWPLSIGAKKSAIADATRLFGARGALDLDRDIAQLSAIADLREQLDRISQTLPPTSGWRGLDTDLAHVETLINTAAGIRAATTRLAAGAAALPATRVAVRSLLTDGRELLQPGMPIAASAESLVTCVQRLRLVLDEFFKAGSSSAAESVDLENVRNTATAIVSRVSRLNAWCQWQSRREQGLGVGLSSIVAGLESGLIRHQDTAQAFTVSYARWIAPLLIDASDVLRRFSPVEHEYLLTSFRALEENLEKLAAETIAARLRAVIPDQAAADSMTGFGVLRREVQRRSSSTTVRNLVAEMGPALTRLTPCVLMSPHSVAQFLGPSAEKFDLVVFDEASQIAVWDAIGAIARGRNVIIVGDPKQMPPTSFFSRSADVDDASDGDAAGATEKDLESIIDEGLGTGMHHHRLIGHYRSQHESLIAFSNHKYYNGELVTYPSSVTEQTAVHFRRCNGAYQKGAARTNPDEAQAVVAEISTRLLDPARRHQTIGVVTMNAQQQQLIRNLLDEARRRTPALESAFRDSAGEEVEMVYNLETVQGHERDVIMLSIGYGPTVVGDRTMSMNFGPLNRLGGERRLNVAVTRAIREVIVFASFDPDMIDLTRTTATAVHDLRAYLEFAQRGPIALARQVTVVSGVDQFDSAFEESVAIRLRALGWTIQTQVGVSKFRIDLGVVHPDAAGRFLAGVECDGATFHSSSTARDRDRVRHGVLTSLGWKLIRLWSTDFFLDPDRATNRVHDALTALLTESREQVTAQQGVTASVNGAGVADVMDELSVDLVEEHETDDDLETDGAEATTPSHLTSSAAVEPMQQDLALVDNDDAAEAASIAVDERNHAPAMGGDTPLRAFAAQFYDSSYLRSLRPVCLEHIDRAGPITFVHLAEKIARAHGFLRTGSEIKKVVWAAVGRQRKVSKAPDGSVTFWPVHLEPVAHVPFRGLAVLGEPRPWATTPYVEKLGLALSVVQSHPQPLRVTEMARRLGVGRLRTKTRDELVELLESAAALREGNSSTLATGE